MKDIRTIAAIKAVSKQAGKHFFDKETMKFWKSRVYDDLYHCPDGRILFITSEQYGELPRLYKVREFNTETARISTLGEFQGYQSKAAAMCAAAKLALGTVQNVGA
jgi:hypothetical protein